MRRSRPLSVAALFVMGALLEPIGHELAYDLRYGVAQAMQLQAQGAHAYFPPIASLSALSIVAGLVLAAMAVLAVRLAFGGPAISTTGWGRAFLSLSAAQCSLFFVQEILETLSRGSQPQLAAIGLLALFAQLPLAALAAWLLARLQGYVALAPEAFRAIFLIRVRRATDPLRLRPLPAIVCEPQALAARAHSRRGPPRSR